MNKHNVISLQDRDRPLDPLTELLRGGAGQLIHQAVEGELKEFLCSFAGQR
jgi:hypothetical protein